MKEMGCILRFVKAERLKVNLSSGISSSLRLK